MRGGLRLAPGDLRIIAEVLLNVLSRLLPSPSPWGASRRGNPGPARGHFGGRADPPFKGLTPECWAES